MALPYPDWLPRAEKLKEGRTQRVSHDCGDGTPLIIAHEQLGYRAYCHRCGDKGWKPHGRRALDKQLKAYEERQDVLRKPWDISLPKDLSRDNMPSAASLWLANGGITYDLQCKYNIGYSEHFGRVFLPVYSGGRLVYYQARAVHTGQTPKYINPAIDKTALRFVAGEGSRVVVCEDILSSIRIGEIKGWRGCAVLGTSFSTSDINYIVRYEQSYAWFDPDAAGIKATRELTKKLSLLGKSVTPIKTDNDPKCYSNREIEEILHDSC